MLQGALALAFVYLLVFALLGASGCAQPRQQQQYPDLRTETIRMMSEVNARALQRENTR